jgi:hypothetical protein
MLFVGNYFNEEQIGKATYTHPVSGEKVSMPYLQDEMLFPSLYAILTPICLEVSAGLKMLHCTSDILGIEKSDNQIHIILQGDRDLQGEIVFEGPEHTKIETATLDGESLKMHADSKRIAFAYSHKHKQELKLNIKLS